MIESNGNTLLKSLSETRGFFRQLSLMIRTVDSLLAKSGWEEFSTNRCTVLSGHCLQPDKWMPSTIFRFYRMVEEGSECTSQALFIGILLDRNNNNWGGFTEPWLTYGLYEFDSEETLDKFKDWSWVEGPFDDQNDPDGKFTRVKVEDVEDVDSREEWDPVGLVYQALAALPLVKIQSAEDLKDLVIDPLLLELDERTGSGSGD